MPSSKSDERIGFECEVSISWTEWLIGVLIEQVRFHQAHPDLQPCKDQSALKVFV